MILSVVVTKGNAPALYAGAFETHLNHVTVDHDVVGSTPIRHPSTRLPIPSQGGQMFIYPT